MDLFDVDVEALKKAKARLYYQEWKKSNAGHLKQYRKARYEANKDKFKAQAKQRHFIKKKIINYLLVHQRGRCATCAKNIIEDYHLDHVMPLNLGGTHDRSNFQLLCPSCNLSKAAKDPLAFLNERGKLC